MSNFKSENQAAEKYHVGLSQRIFVSCSSGNGIIAATSALNWFENFLTVASLNSLMFVFLLTEL